jgi:hypothetical protein
MRGIVGLVLGLGVTLVLAGGCKKENAAYCCTVDTCTTVVECPSDGGHLVCDDTGLHGEAHSCILDPSLPDGGGACETMSDCTDPGTPFCVDQVCVQCEGANGCSAEEPVCGAANSCLGCGSEGDCHDAYPDTPHCGSDGHCVACRSSAEDCDPLSTSPVCDEHDATCRHCQADDECATGLCDETSGACVPESNIVHVSAAAAGGLGCGTAASPCKTITEGVDATVAPNRIWVEVASGSYRETLTIADRTVKIVGAAGGSADLQPIALGAACALVSGNADVTIERLRLHDAGGGGSTGVADGVRCALGAGSVSPRLLLREVAIDGCAAQGVDASSCDVTIERSTISTNVGGGVRVGTGKLTLERSRIDGNTDGGVLITASDFSLVNNFIVKNGSVLATFGGVYVNMNPPSGPSGARFDLNTVSGNDTADGFSSGVRCDVSTPLSFRNNVVYSNEPDSVPATIGQVSGPNCKWTFSDIGPGAAVVTGDGNLNLDPTFKDVPAGDYHLTDASLVKDVGTPTDVHVDFDGEMRPQGGGVDMGADEVKVP